MFLEQTWSQLKEPSEVVPNRHFETILADVLFTGLPGNQPILCLYENPHSPSV